MIALDITPRLGINEHKQVIDYKTVQFFVRQTKRNRNETLLVKRFTAIINTDVIFVF